jgi:hypothetical protein
MLVAVGTPEIDAILLIFLNDDSIDFPQYYSRLMKGDIQPSGQERHNCTEIIIKTSQDQTLEGLP